MTTINPKPEVASDYGEGDIEAEAMTDAAVRGAPERATSGPVPPDDFVPASGTTETDVAKNLDTKMRHETKS